jgi:hypothetical protein
MKGTNEKVVAKFPLPDSVKSGTFLRWLSALADQCIGVLEPAIRSVESTSRHCKSIGGGYFRYKCIIQPFGLIKKNSFRQ